MRWQTLAVTPAVDTAARRASRRRSVGIGFAAALVIALVAGGTFFDNLGRVRFGRQPLSAIGVSADACPYLNRVHTLVVRLDRQWTDALAGRDRWPTFRTELATELPALQAALVRSEPYVPEPIGSRFETMVLDLRLGVAELPQAASVMDVLVRPGTSKSPLVDGVNALADASDLVGEACGYRLAPSNELTP
jgi:hypothetical protein